MADTGVTKVDAVATYTFNFTSNPIIPAGTYWMMALCEDAATPRMDDTNGASLVAYFQQPFAAGMPTIAPGSINFTGQNYNYWINGKSIPEPASIGLFGIAALFALMRFRCRVRGGRGTLLLRHN